MPDHERPDPAPDPSTESDRRDPLAVLRAGGADPQDAPFRSHRWRGRLEPVADALGVTVAGLGRAVALVVAVGLAAVAVVAVVVVAGVGRGGGGDGAPPVPLDRDAGLPFAGTTTAPTAPAALFVHAAGAVTRPGVYELPAGARVVDLVDAAGGPTPDADPARVNLAEPLADGARVYLPRLGEVPPPGPPPAAGSGGGEGVSGSGSDAGLVDLNTADEAELDELPGIGPATAASIVAHRSVNGPFGGVDELLDVRGIGPAKLEQLRPLVTTGG